MVRIELDGDEFYVPKPNEDVAELRRLLSRLRVHNRKLAQVVLVLGSKHQRGLESGTPQHRKVSPKTLETAWKLCLNSSGDFVPALPVFRN